MIAAPHPYERIRQRLLEYFDIAMSRGPAEYEAVVIALGFEGRGGPLVGHHPVVIGLLRIFGAVVVFGHMREDSQRLLLAGFDQLHAGMVFPRAERILLFFRRVIVLLIDERS